jgi:hypothetical protein
MMPDKCRKISLILYLCLFPFLVLMNLFFLLYLPVIGFRAAVNYYRKEKGETAQQQTQTLNQIYIEEKKNTAQTSKGSNLHNPPSIERA